VRAGYSNYQIARRLGLSEGTVRKHLENAFNRLGVTSRAAAVAALGPDLLAGIDGPALSIRSRVVKPADNMTLAQPADADSPAR